MQVTKISATQKLKKKKLVCAYARVSNDKDSMLHSLSAQVQYYKEYISSNDDWLFVKVYYDEGISGTKDDRPAFKQMIQDAKDGKIDLIIAKSISRFARNTLTLLETVRELKAYNVDVYFEEQHIHSISSDGELMLTILASYAQEEARSVSENMKWRVKKNFEEGKPWGRAPFGYTLVDNKFVIVPKDAEVVSLIFKLYLEGNGLGKIGKILDKSPYKPIYSKRWSSITIGEILKNYIYTGNVVLQTTYSENYITKKMKKNKGEKPKYHVEDSHEPIISLEDYNKVQEILRERRNKMNIGGLPKEYLFKGKVICGKCSIKMQRKKNYKKFVWICHNYVKYGPEGCKCKQVPDNEIIRLTSELLETNELTIDLVNKRIEKIVVGDNRLLTFYFTNGEVKDVYWIQRSRKESWTDEMKELARQRSLQIYLETEGANNG